PMRIFGPGRSAMMATARPADCAAARMFWMFRSCAANSPWEKFSRATFIPARIMRPSTSGDSDAGPMVATIRVLLGRSYNAVASYVAGAVRGQGVPARGRGGGLVPCPRRLDDPPGNREIRTAARALPRHRTDPDRGRIPV